MYSAPAATERHSDLADPLVRLQRRAWPVDEARELLGGISRASIYELINSGELRTVMLAGRRLVPDDAITALLAGPNQSAG